MTDKLNRRGFLRGGVATAAAAGAVAAPTIARAESTVLKMQAAWGGGIWLENAKSFAKRVNDMSGGSLTIDVLPVNSIVKTSQMDAGCRAPRRAGCRTLRAGLLVLQV